MTLARLFSALGVAALLTLCLAPAARAGGMHLNEAEDKDESQATMKHSMMTHHMHHRMHHRAMQKGM